MTDFVLDNSVATRWLINSTNRQEQKYAEMVLHSIDGTQRVLVPTLWYLEATNILLISERNGKTTTG